MDSDLYGHRWNGGVSKEKEGGDIVSDPNYEPPKTNPETEPSEQYSQYSCSASLLMVLGAFAPSVLVILFGTEFIFENGKLTERLIYIIGAVALVIAIGMGVFLASRSGNAKKNYEGYVILWITIHTILYFVALGIAFVAGCSFLPK